MSQRITSPPLFFFFNDTATTEIYTLSLHDALPISTLCLARECPLALAPAMNRQMWDNPATQRNVARLRADGVTLLGPAAGDQACREVGMGRMVEPEEIFAAVVAALGPKPLAGKPGPG